MNAVAVTFESKSLEASSEEESKDVEDYGGGETESINDDVEVEKLPCLHCFICGLPISVLFCN